MKELKSKKTGRISIISDAEYAEIINKRAIDISKFTVSDIRTRPIVSAKVPDEVKKIPRKNEG